MGGLAPFVWYANAEIGSDTPNNLTDRSGTPTKPYGRMIQRYIGTDTGSATPVPTDNLPGRQEGQHADRWEVAQPSLIRCIVN